MSALRAVASERTARNHAPRCIRRPPKPPAPWHSGGDPVDAGVAPRSAAAKICSSKRPSVRRLRRRRGARCWQGNTRSQPPRVAWRDRAPDGLRRSPAASYQRPAYAGFLLVRARRFTVHSDAVGDDDAIGIQAAYVNADIEVQGAAGCPPPQAFFAQPATRAEVSRLPRKSACNSGRTRAGGAPWARAPGAGQQ